MIKQNVIDELRHKMEIQEVIADFVKLKRRGSGQIGLCPFHNEKSPSFNVMPSKQIYKCFGCGEGGDAIKFIMKHERKSFTEAVEWLCGFYNISIEYDQVSQQEAEEKKEAREVMLQLVSWAQKKYEDLLFSLPEEAPVLQYLQQRGYTEDRVRSWQPWAMHPWIGSSLPHRSSIWGNTHRLLNAASYTALKAVTGTSFITVLLCRSMTITGF